MARVSSPFDPSLWRTVPGFAFTDITYHRALAAPVVRIAFDRPDVRNAFRPHTVDELHRALDHARMSSDVGAVLLTATVPQRTGRRLGLLLGWRSADSRTVRLPVRRRGDGGKTVDPGQGSAGCTSWRCSG